MLPSCTLVRSPTVISDVSPRITVPNHTPTSSPSKTCPMTCASGAIHTPLPITGTLPSSS